MAPKKTEIEQLFSSFEACRFEYEGTEAWRARRLLLLFGYTKWERFRGAIGRAWHSCASIGVDPAANFLLGDGDAAWNPDEVFPGAGKNLEGGRPSEDVILTRRAAYLVAMNGDPRKPEIAFAQHYFAAATRTLEILRQKMAEAERLLAREELTETEARFQGVLYEHGVEGTGISRIRSKGDKVLFGGHDTQAMKARWQITGARPLADFAPEVIIRAKQLGSAITAHNVKAHDLEGEMPICAEHEENNRTVRETLRSRGIVPEELSPEEDIKKVERRHAAELKKLDGPGNRKAGAKTSKRGSP
jgi:DNA-damage-inducible protein D